jgi:apolipoprotein D and lipocalin family protein
MAPASLFHDLHNARRQFTLRVSAAILRVKAETTRTRAQPNCERPEVAVPFTLLWPRKAASRIFFAAALVFGCHQESLDVANDVDLNRFSGKWFEIARLPRATESECTATTAYYAVTSRDQLTMVNECHLGSPAGPVRSVSASARVPDPSVPAKLSVDFGGFYGDYWIIDLGAHYEYAVVGHPTREFLWILSRTPVLAETTLRAILDRARAKQFDVTRLEYTQQS